MKTNLTTKFLEKDWSPSKRITYTDVGCKNLMVVIDPNGRVYWRWQGKVNGRVRQVALGQFPAVSIAEARAKAADLTQKRDNAKTTAEPLELPRRVIRVHPVIELPVEPVGVVDEKTTCDWLFDLYMQHEGSKKASGTEKRRAWDKDIKPFIGHKRYAEIGYDDLAEVIAAKVETAPGAANHLVAYIRRLFKWAVTKGRPFTKLEADPSMHLIKPSEVNVKDRFLTDREIVWFFKAVDSFNDAFSDALVLSIYAGTRKSETFDMPWKEYDAKTGRWLIPKDRVKNGDALLLPLPPSMQALLKARREATGEGTYVFPSTRGDKPMGGFTKLLDRFKAKMVQVAAADAGAPVEIEKWSIHDLRRTLSTGMNSLVNDKGDPLVSGEIVERVLNHRIRGVAGTYNHNEYLTEKRRALELWAAHLDGLRAKARQVEMRQAA
jgi:integrase